MKISVNLATRPFVELRPFFARLRLLMALLVVVAIAIGVTVHMVHVKLDVADAQMNRLKAQTLKAQTEKANNEKRMRQPANSEVLERSHFLNALFLRKSFSWTAVMMDLENVLPIGVQVTSIEPQISSEGDVVIHLRVSGDRDRAVQLVRNLERSKRFLGPHINSESSELKTTNGAPLPPGATAGVEFEILANYNPLPEGTPFAKAKRESDTATVAARPGVVRPGVVRPGVVRPGVVRQGIVKPGPRDGIVLKPFVSPKPVGGAR